MLRKIIRIDEEKCDGCGLCAKACHEGAIRVVDGKARLVSETYCDGLGACIGECPRDAITIEEREAAAFDEAAVAANQVRQAAPTRKTPGGCPGMAAFAFGARAPASAVPAAAAPSELRQWPVQLHLVPVQAPYWDGADLLVTADCVPVAFADYHARLLRGRRVIIACPKLDDTSEYVEKLAAILARNAVRSVRVAHMEVPCCTGLVRIVEAALADCGKTIPFSTVTVGIRGDLLES